MKKIYLLIFIIFSCLCFADKGSYDDTKFRQDLINSGPIDRIFDKTINSTYPIYGCRTVFSVEFGSVKQVLVLNLTHDDLVWINV